MRNNLFIAAAFAASTFVASSASAAPTLSEYPDPICLLHAGCFFDGGGWVCSDPTAYMLCLEP